MALSYDGFSCLEPRSAKTRAWIGATLGKLPLGRQRSRVLVKEVSTLQVITDYDVSVI